MADQKQVVVRFVEEDALPAEQPWVIGVTHRGERFLFLKRGAVSQGILEEAWTAGLALPITPAQRRLGRDGMRVAV